MPFRDPQRTQFLFLNLGHLYDHLFMLLYATAVVAIQRDAAFEGSYGYLLTLSTLSFIAFGAGSLPSGWLGDKWSKHGMMSVFFIGIGAASIFTGFAEGPVSLTIGLLAVGIFASIYHPVGIAMVADNARSLGKEIGINGVFGNVGVALAAVTAGFLTDLISWRAAFIVPGVISIATGLAYVAFAKNAPEPSAKQKASKFIGAGRAEIIRVLIIVAIGTMFFTVIFNSTTVSLPKVFDDRLGGLAETTSAVGWWAFLVFMIAAVAQILIGHMLDRYPIKPVYLLTVAGQVPFLLFVAHASGWNMIGGAMAMMFLVFGTIPIHDTIVARYAAPDWRSRVFAVKYLLGLTTAATAVPLVGWLYDRTGGFETLFFVLTGFAAVITCCALAMPGRRPQPVAAE